METEYDVPAQSGQTTATRVLVATATYNEIENLPIFVARLREALPDVELLVIDDNSPDGTGTWCDEQVAADGKIHCIHRQGKLGLGTAIVAAMKYAVDNQFDILVNMDADLSHPPEMIQKLVDAAQRCGVSQTVAIGSRYAEGGGIEGWPAKRHFMSRAINLYSRILLRLPTQDCSGSFRAYPVALLKLVKFKELHSTGYSFFEEILYRLKEKGARFVEVPYTFIERVHGVSKINLKEAAKAVAVIGRVGISAWFGV